VFARRMGRPTSQYAGWAQCNITDFLQAPRAAPIGGPVRTWTNYTLTYAGNATEVSARSLRAVA
jgi:hypothetical protein